jgi:hypothetical protein
VGDATDSQRDSNRDHEHGGSTDTPEAIQKREDNSSSTNSGPFAFTEADPTAVESSRDSQKSVHKTPSITDSNTGYPPTNPSNSNLNDSSTTSGKPTTDATEPSSSDNNDIDSNHQSTDPPFPPEQTPPTISTPKKEEPLGTGEKYIKSTGFAADGGDFDATRPGAGREADRAPPNPQT